MPILCFCIAGIKCPVCNKFVPPDDIECHLVVCLTKPRITYNGKSICVLNRTKVKSIGVPNKSKNHI